MPLKLQVHTFNISHRITEWEAKRIKQEFQVALNERLKIGCTGIVGINQIEIKENPVYGADGVILKSSYQLCLQVNLGKLLKISNVAMVAINKANGKRMITALSKVMNRDLQLSPKNSNPEQWILNRLDCGFDIDLSQFIGRKIGSIHLTGVYIHLLHNALNLHNNRHCTLKPYKGCDSQNAQWESLYFGNDSYTYNIYSKHNQLIRTYGYLPQKQHLEAEYILRIEKQIFGKGIANGIGSPQKLALLLDETVIQKVFDNIVRDIKTFFGTGDFVPYEDAVQTIEQSSYSKEYKKRLNIVLMGISKFGYHDFVSGVLAEAKQNGIAEEIEKERFKRYREDIEALEISVSSIFEDDIEDTLQGIFSIVSPDVSKNPTGRKKGKFGRIYQDKVNSRYRCNITVHNAEGGQERFSMADTQKERFEDKILDKLVEVHNQNILEIQSNPEQIITVTEQTKADIQNFRTTIDRPELLEKIDNVLLNL